MYHNKISADKHAEITVSENLSQIFSTYKIQM